MTEQTPAEGSMAVGQIVPEQEPLVVPADAAGQPKPVQMQPGQPMT